MKLTRIIASAFILLATSAASFAQTADEIVAKHIEAMGGAEKWKALKAMEMVNKFNIQGMDLEQKITIVNGKSLRTDMSVMGQEMISVIDGETGWAQQPAMVGGTGEPEDMPGSLVKESKKQVNLGGSLLNYKEKGGTVELVGKEKLDGVDVYHLKLTEKSGDISNFYLSAANYYILKTAGKRTIQGKETEAEVSYSNFKQVDGLTFPHTMEVPNPMAVGTTMTIETDSIKLNPKIDESIFKKPAKK